MGSGLWQCGRSVPYTVDTESKMIPWDGWSNRVAGRQLGWISDRKNLNSASLHLACQKLLSQKLFGLQVKCHCTDSQLWEPNAQPSMGSFYETVHKGTDNTQLKIDAFCGHRSKHVIHSFTEQLYFYPFTAWMLTAFGLNSPNPKKGLKFSSAYMWYNVYFPMMRKCWFKSPWLHYKHPARSLLCILVLISLEVSAVH